MTDEQVRESVPAGGVQNERTALAWQRTALSVLLGGAVLVRLNHDGLGLFGVLSAVLSVPLAAWIFVESRARYRHDACIRARPRSRGGRAPLMLSAAVAILGVMELEHLWAGL